MFCFVKFLSFLFKFSIIFFNFFKKIIQIAFKTFIRQEFINNNIFFFNRITSFTGKYQNFSDNICSAKINTWIRF